MVRRCRVLAAFAATLSLVLSPLAAPPLAEACTGITIRPKDGSVIYGRTLEFGADLQSNAVVIPRGFEYSGTTPTGQPGLRWKSKYAVAGANAFNLPMVLDGFNEQGLACGLFYFPGYAQYQSATAEQLPNTIAPWELGIYVLGTCGTIDEARAAIKNVRVASVVQPQMGIVPPAHYIFTDSAGRATVVEYIDGELKIHENLLGVFTNAPTFDWHVTNLGNYINLSPTGNTSIKIGEQKVNALGQGSGMLGLPGDFTPPSRFVRAVAFSKSALPVETAGEGVLQLFHILNQFDIPKGSARSIEGGKEVSDYTLWTSANDLKNLRFYFRTNQNSRIRMVDMKQVNLDGKEMVVFPMSGDEEIVDLSAVNKRVEHATMNGQQATTASSTATAQPPSSPPAVTPPAATRPTVTAPLVIMPVQPQHRERLLAWPRTAMPGEARRNR
jgi:choloylglycine hydrolase